MGERRVGTELIGDVSVATFDDGTVFISGKTVEVDVWKEGHLTVDIIEKNEIREIVIPKEIVDILSNVLRDRK